jgi:hypothetical protein
MCVKNILSELFDMLLIYDYYVYILFLVLLYVQKEDGRSYIDG